MTSVSTSASVWPARFQAIAAWVAAIVAIAVLLASREDRFVRVEQYRDDRAAVERDITQLRADAQTREDRMAKRLDSIEAKLDRLIEQRVGGDRTK